MNHLQISRPKLALLISLIFASCTNTHENRNEDVLPVISKTEGNFIIHFSNKLGSFWSTETALYNNHWSTGFVSYRKRIFGEVVPVLNGVKPDRSKASIVYTPVEFRRSFESGFTENWFMPDGEDALVVEFSSSSKSNLQVHIEDLALDTGSVIQTIQRNSVSILSAALMDESGKWISIASSTTIKDLPTDTQGQLRIDLGDSSPSTTLVIAIGDDEVSAGDHAIRILGSVEALKQQKKERIHTLYAGRTVNTSDNRLNQAWLWALSSFDALNMNEEKSGMGKGIYAGYPWFQDYWGRDSFIALRALTVTGQFELAAANLESFLKYQMLDSLNPAYGKIPNRVRPGDIIYNTADATPRFIIEADRYVAYSKDTAFARRIFPQIEAAVKGTLRYRTDADGLLVHGDADTWMDAVGPNGPYSPRGNRAVDIQALWIDALQAASNIARFKRGSSADELMHLAQESREKALAAFLTSFVVTKSDTSEKTLKLYDVITATNKPSPQIRPNAFFAYHLIPGTQSKKALAQQLTQQLGTPWGLLSLDASDPWFHPYHKAEPLYEQDASYHNGIVWLWNTGIWVEALTRHGQYEQAWEVSRNYVDIMLDNITLGTLPELIDAMPRKGRFVSEFPTEKEFQGISRLDQMSLRNSSNRPPEVPALSGTWSQAWSLSEFIRNVVEDYGGLRYDLQQGFTLSPSIPRDWGDVLIRRQFAGYAMDLRRMTSVNGQVFLLRFEGGEKAAPMELPFQLPNMKEALILELSGFADVFEIREKRGMWTFIRNNQAYQPKIAPANPWHRGSEEQERWPLWKSSGFDVDKARYRSHLPLVAND